MKKFARLSLVAAFAVAGMTTANAKDLSEAIKNTDISGTLTYRYDDRDKDGGNITQNSYKAGVNFKSKVNDNVTANVRFTAANVKGVGADDNGPSALQTTNASDNNVDVKLALANFAVKAGPATVIAGKQALNTPFTVGYDAIGNDQTGTGALALVNVGPATVAAAYFNQTNLNLSGDVKAGTGAENVIALAAMAKVGPVALDAWYLDRDEVYSVWTIGAKAKVSGISVDARHTSLETEAGVDNSLTKVGLKAKFGIVGAAVAYGFTGEDGGLAAEDHDAKAGFQGWGLNLNNVKDSSLLKTNVNVDVMKGLNVAANYNILTRDDVANSDKTEYYGQVTYKMSKNFMTYVRVGQVDPEVGAKGTRGRLHVQYSF
jgi:hypothetical protein